MEDAPSVPVPKPRTRFNLNSSGNETPIQEPVIQSIYPPLPSPKLLANVLSVNTANLAAIDENFQSDVAPPKPPRESPDIFAPPTRPPPPAGWNVDVVLPQRDHRVAPPPPAPKADHNPNGRLYPDIVSGGSPPTIPAPMLPKAATPSPPSRPSSASPAIPPRPLKLNSIVPVGDSRYVTLTSSSAPNFTTDGPAAKVMKTIENPVYLCLDQFRSMAFSSSNESGFHSLPSPQITDASKFNDPFDDEPATPTSLSDFPELTGTIDLVSPSDLLALKPRPPSGGMSLTNAYTPPPKMSDFTLPLERDVLFAPQDTVTEIDQHDCEDSAIPLDTDASTEEMDGTAVSFFGYVMIHVGKKERKRAHARLRNMNLSFHEDDETSDFLSGPFQLIGCQLISRQDATVYIRLSEMESQKHIIFTVEESPDTWSLLLGECWLTQYDLLRSSVSGMSTCGTIWLKQGTAAGWQCAAAALVGRSLHYVLLDSPDYIYELDVRKVLGIREKVEKDQWCSQIKKKNSRGPFMLTLEGCSLFLECEDEWSSNRWYCVVNDILTATPSALDEYRLTGDNVPIIVDKCIRFISAFGMSSEGVYRRNGKISEAKDILSRLSIDPAGVHLVPLTDETVYAVADVLRQFFRRLATPLFPHECHAELFSTVNLNCEAAHRWTELHRVLHALPVVHYSTLRKLMAHLKEVSSHCGQNRASVENLAKVFGPSLFHTEAEQGICFQDNSNQITVIAVLIAAYDKVFELTTREEISREMVEQAQKFRTPQKKAVRADGLLVPIHLWERENRPFNVKTDLAAEEVCREAVVKRGFDAPMEGKYALFELVRGGSLSRRLPESERLSAAVINRWLPWKCLDGYLLFDHDKQDNHDDMTSFTGKVKVAEPGSKTFKSYELKVELGTKVVAFKGEKQWKQWILDETVWYYGAEPNRKAPYPYNLTFLQVDGTSFNDKLIGHCVSFKSSDERMKFANRVYYVQTGGQPTPLVHI